MEFFIGLAIITLLWIIAKASKKSKSVTEVPNTYKRPEEPIEDKVHAKLPEVDQI
jgi:hypothetical protein